VVWFEIKRRRRSGCPPNPETIGCGWRGSNTRIQQNLCRLRTSFPKLCKKILNRAALNKRAARKLQGQIDTLEAEEKE
jgi:hypothetical protein